MCVCVCVWVWCVCGGGGGVGGYLLVTFRVGLGGPGKHIVTATDMRVWVRNDPVRWLICIATFSGNVYLSVVPPSVHLPNKALGRAGSSCYFDEREMSHARWRDEASKL
ncbi:hypothetical protein T492DRAFT_840359 [Pavlovales sp. CCMP2436]|nr:hypothetical protein T492DRAFT_840359 [Pavlovales sp. CCMP2436]